MANLNGTSGNDTITGTTGADNINGNGGNDILYGLGGNDNIDGGAGADYIDGGSGNNNLQGGTGNDTLLAGAGNDVLDGGADNDWLDAGEGENRLRGGTGMDTLLAGAGNDDLDGGANDDWLAAGDGDNRLQGGTGNDTLLAGSGNDFLEGGAENDWLQAGAGDNRLEGGTGADTLLAGAGADELDGGAGDDLLNSGGGSDEVFGATGNDLFVYRQAENAGAADDYDGGAGIDSLRLELTLAERLDPTLQADLIGFFQFIAANTNPNGQANNEEFQFAAFGLTVNQIEDIELVVDGQAVDPHAAFIVGGASGALGEDDTAPVTGALTVFDIDPGEAHTQAVAGATSLVGLGTYSVDADGSWSYTLDNAAAQFLADGETTTDSFVVASLDGSAQQTVTIAIAGANDAPEFSGGDTTGSITALSSWSFEDRFERPDSLALGNGWIQDGQVFTEYTKPNGDLVDVTYSSLLDEAVQFDVFRHSQRHGGDLFRRGSERTLNVQNNFGEDLSAGTAVLEFDLTPSTTEWAHIVAYLGSEAGGVSTGVDAYLLDGVGVRIYDRGVGTNDTEFQIVHHFTGGTTGVLASSSLPFQLENGTTYRLSFQIAPDGAATATLSNGAQTAALSAAVGGLVDEIDKVLISNSIGLTYDFPTVTHDSMSFDNLSIRRIVDSSSTLSDSGSLTFDDVDLTDSHSVSVAAFGSNAIGGSLSAVVSDPATGAAGNGTVSWTYTVANSALQYLAAGETASESFTLTVEDSHGGTDSDTVTVALQGVNDSPAIGAGVTTGTVVEDGALSATGTVAFADVDLTDTHAVSATPSGSDYLGTFNAFLIDDSTGDGSGSIGWSFSVENENIVFLNDGQSLQQVYAVNVDDGQGGIITQTMTINIDGADDSPILFQDNFDRADSANLGDPQVGGLWHEINELTQEIDSPNPTGPATIILDDGALGFEYTTHSSRAFNTFGSGNGEHAAAFAELARSVSDEDVTVSFTYTPNADERVSHAVGLMSDEGLSENLTYNPGSHYQPENGIMLWINRSSLAFANSLIQIYQMVDGTRSLISSTSFLPFQLEEGMEYSFSLNIESDGDLIATASDGTMSVTLSALAPTIDYAFTDVFVTDLDGGISFNTPGLATQVGRFDDFLVFV